MAKNTQLMFSGMQADAALIVPGNFSKWFFERKKCIEKFLLANCATDMVFVF